VRKLSDTVLFARQRGVINFLGPSIPACGVVCASSATWLFPFACEAFMLSNYELIDHLISTLLFRYLLAYLLNNHLVNSNFHH
jgi:hypothetical protein